MQIHKMKLQEKYFSMIKSGEKTIELRLFDDKRKNIKIGDIIEFCDIADKNETLQTKVIGLHKAADFSALCAQIDCKLAGFSTPDKLCATMNKFYTPEAQKHFGVIGIELARL
jgi:ASC-1-like (ASCH) protein